MNVNSLLCKLDYVSMFARDYELDVVAVSESWLIESIPSSFAAIESYSVLRGDVHGSIRKHGTCLNVRDNLRFEEVETNCPDIVTVC